MPIPQCYNNFTEIPVQTFLNGDSRPDTNTFVCTRLT